METTLFKEPKQRLKDGRYCSDEQKRIEMSIDDANCLKCNCKWKGGGKVIAGT